MVVRYTAEGAKLNLTIKTSSKHAGTKVRSAGNQIVLTGAANMVQDPVEFMQVVQIDPGQGRVRPQADGSIQVTDASDVQIFLAGYCDYLPVYPSFKGRDYQGIAKRQSRRQPNLKSTRCDKRM